MERREMERRELERREMEMRDKKMRVREDREGSEEVKQMGEGGREKEEDGDPHSRSMSMHTHPPIT